MDGRPITFGPQARPHRRAPPRDPRTPVAPPRRRSVKNALIAATAPTEGALDAQAVLIEAISALDRAAKVGAIHPNAAARRKSRLTRTVNAAVGGALGQCLVPTSPRPSAGSKPQKAAKARIAASKADKAKGAQTAAGKARAALSKTSRTEAAGQGLRRRLALPRRSRPRPPRDDLSSAGAKPAAKKTAAGRVKPPAARPAAKATAKTAATATAKPTAKKAAAKKG